MNPAQVEEFFMAVKQPGRIVDMPKLIEKFGLKNKEIGKLNLMLREMILSNPELMKWPASIESAVASQWTTL